MAIKDFTDLFTVLYVSCATIIAAMAILYELTPFFIWISNWFNYLLTIKPPNEVKSDNKV